MVEGGPQWPRKLGKVPEWVRCGGGFMVAVWVLTPLSTPSPAGLTQPSLCLLSPSSPLPIVQGPAIFWFYFLMRLPWAFSRYFSNIVPSPREVWGGAKLPEGACCLGTTSFLSLAVGFPPSWLLLWGKHCPSPLALGPWLPGLTGTLWSLGASTFAGRGSRLCFWPRLLQDPLSSVMRHEPGWARLALDWDSSRSVPTLLAFVLEYSLSAELLPPWNCFPQVIFRGIYQRRKWGQPFLSLGLTCVLALISLSCTKSNSSRLCTSSVPLTAPFVKTALSRCNLHATRFTGFKCAT